MVDIGTTVRLSGAYKSVPSVPGNGQTGTATNDVAFFGTNISNHFLSGSTDSSFAAVGQTYRPTGVVNLPTPVATYYYLAANLTIGGTREYWTDVTPTLVNAPSGPLAYVTNSLAILGTFQVSGSISIPTVTSVYPAYADPTFTFYARVSGANFVDGATVTFNGISATEVIFISSKLIYCLAPVLTTVGTVNVVVTNPNSKTSGTTGNAAVTCPTSPTITSITPTSGLSGTSITDLHGTGFLTGATVTFGGLAATNVVVVSSTQISCTSPASTVGSTDVVVTNTTGQTSGTSGNGIYTTLFSPATLNLTSWLNGDYPGTLPWSGTASAGVSGSNNEVTIGGTAPSSGAGAAGVLNGHVSASYNGSTQRSQLGTTIDTYIDPSGYTLSALVYFTASPAYTPTLAYQHTQILCADARWGVTFSAGGITVFHYNGSTFPSVTVACTASAWHIIDVRYDGVNINIRVDGGSWTTSALAQQQSGLQAMTARNTYSVTNAGAMNLMERITSKQQLSDSDLNNYRGYINARYGTSF